MATDLINVGTADAGDGATLRAGGVAVNTMLQAADATSAAQLILLEDTTGGTNKHTITSGTTAISADRTIALGDVSVTLDQDVASGADVTFNDVTIGTTSLISAEDATAAAFIRLAEDTDNGTSYTTITPAQALGGNRTLQLGDLDVTLDQDVASGANVTFGTIASGNITAGTTTTFRAETAGVTGAIVLAELTGGGTDAVTIAAPNALSAARSVTLPDADVDLTELNTIVALWARPTSVSVGAANATTVAFTFKATDENGNDEARAVPYDWILSSSATTGAVHGTVPDGNVTFTTGLSTAVHTTDLAGRGITDVNGDAVLTVVHAADAQDYYFWITMGGSTITSTKLEIT